MTIFKILAVVIFAFLLGCKSHLANIPKTSSADTSSKIKTITLKRYDKNVSNPLFVFVGEKIDVTPLPHKIESMDNGFRARHKILQSVFGQFPGDTIEFVAYDHYGIPAFSGYKNALLFVSEDNGYYYHQKYLFNDVYKTKDKRWAGCYSLYDYEHPNNKHTKIKPLKIDFAESVTYPIKTIDPDGNILTHSYQKTYFKTIGDTAFAVYGNYVEELFVLTRDGVLTSRELFKDGKLTHY
jgi:hypothetical protein